MKESKKNVWKAVKKVAEMEADMKNTGWPPDCYGFLYQPRRPKRGGKLKRINCILGIVMSIAIMTGMSFSVCAAPNAKKQTMNSEKVILDYYTDRLGDIYMLHNLNDEQKNEIRRNVLHECKETLECNGYEAYLVNSASFEQVEQELGTDLSQMGLQSKYTYLISLANDENIDTNARISTGNTFTYTYNNVTYNMRYCTVTAADDPNFSKASDCNLLSSSSETLIQNCLDTAISAYISAVWAPLGTVSSICGLSISDFAPTANATLRLNCGTNWTRVYTQVYSTYDSAWINGSCVEYAKLYSYLSGTYYDANTNSMKKVPEDESSSTKYSAEYTDYTWRKEKAARSLLNGNGCNYDVTGSVSYYYGDTKKITHTENF